MPGQSKTEKATPKKRRDERKEGNVFQSKDVASLILLLASFLAFDFFSGSMVSNASQYMSKYINLSATYEQFDAQDMSKFTTDFMFTVAICILPIALTGIVVGILAHGVQTRFLFVGKLAAPKLNRINPLEGIKKLFALKNLVELLKNLIKMAILLYLLYTSLITFMPMVVRTMDMSIASSAEYGLSMVMSLIYDVVIIFGAIAFFDYFYQKWEYERKIKMSKQDIKDEYKQTEGSPEIKSRIKETQRAMARSRMMQAVPNADVIIRNPTHFAVALSYNTEKNTAPIVVAKGQDEMALRIIKVAEEHSVTVVENKPLARAIYASTELNREIPAEYYGAVAEILVYVYRLNNKLR